MDFYSLQAGNILRSQHEKHVWVDTKVVSDAAFLHDRTRQRRLHPTAAEKMNDSVTDS